MVQTLERPSISAINRQTGDPPGKIVSPEETDHETHFKNEILILISAPLLDSNFQPIESLSIQKEVDGIINILEAISSEINVEIVVKIATTKSMLEAFSYRINPLIVHFIGHGTKNEEGISLVLEDDVGIARPFSSNELRSLLENREPSLCQVALLNACHSEGLAGTLLDADIPHVVAINADDRILDEAALCFSRIFYSALFNGYSVKNAFYKGKNAVYLDDNLNKYIDYKTHRVGVNLRETRKIDLLPENSSVHERSLALQSLARGKIVAPQWEKTNIPSDDPTFIGRRVEIHRIAVALIETNKARCVSLHGMGGMGKTALALAAGRWQHERQRWQDGVWFIDLRDVDSADTARARIMNTVR